MGATISAAKLSPILLDPEAKATLSEAPEDENEIPVINIEEPDHEEDPLLQNDQP